MRYGILSDVHSNLEALEEVLQTLEKDGVDQILCAGDLIGYGADPVQCLKRLRESCTQVVCGNHDWAAAGKMPLDWFNDLARAAVEWTQAQLSESDRSYLKSLPLVWQDANVTLVHASLHEPDQFPYIFDLTQAALSLKLQKTSIAFIGHTHVPAVYLQKGDRAQLLPAAHAKVVAGEKLLVNVGSVGQPRDGDPRACFCLYDTDRSSFEIRRVRYPVDQVQKKMRKAGLPEFLAERIAIGY